MLELGLRITAINAFMITAILPFADLLWPANIEGVL